MCVYVQAWVTACPLTQTPLDQMTALHNIDTFTARGVLFRRSVTDDILYAPDMSQANLESVHYALTGINERKLRRLMFYCNSIEIMHMHTYSMFINWCPLLRRVKLCKNLGMNLRFELTVWFIFSTVRETYTIHSLSVPFLRTFDTLSKLQH